MKIECIPLPECHPPGWVSAPDLLHELDELVPVLADFPGEVLADVDVGALQQSGLPQYLLFVSVLYKIL